MAKKARKSRIRYDRIIIVLIIILLAGIGGFKSGHYLMETVYDKAENILISWQEKNNDKRQEEIADASISQEADLKNSFAKLTIEKLPQKASLIDWRFDLNSLNSQYIYLARLSDGLVLLDKDSYHKIFPASMTKMMTAIVAIESLDDLDALIRVPEDIFPYLRNEGASMAGFTAGEQVSGRDLLYGVILPSGGDASMTLAESIAGSQEAFVMKMNQKAQQLGMTNTHFTNVVGLHDDEHYTTAEDLAKLLQYCLEDDLFYTIVTTKQYSTKATNKHSQGITFSSTVLAKDNVPITFDGGSLLGGKSGYTKEAGLCLASLGQKNGEKYILVTAKAQGTYSSKPYHLYDALTIYGEYLK